MMVHKLGFTMQKIVLWLVFAVFGWGLWSCNNSGDNPDLSGINIALHTRRLDRDLAQVDTNNVGQGLQQLKKQYPDFLDFYLDTLMGFGIEGQYTDSNRSIQQSLRPFLTHPDIRGLFDSVRTHFPDTKKVDADLTEGFRHMAYYYPAYRTPKIIYFISGLGQWSAFTVDSSILAIGLDMFLGQQYPFYHSVQIPQYVIRKCAPEYIAANAFQAIYRYKHPFVTEEKNLLELMIQRGKEQYFLSKILPETPDSIRFGFTKSQLTWCKENEAMVYNFFIVNDLLYEKTPNKVYRFVYDAPTSAGMPPESPGNIGAWLGYRIIEAYVEHHPDIKMEELFALTNAQKLLQASKYKPR